MSIVAAASIHKQKAVHIIPWMVLCLRTAAQDIQNDIDQSSRMHALAGCKSAAGRGVQIWDTQQREYTFSSRHLSGVSLWY